MKTAYHFHLDYTAKSLERVNLSGVVVSNIDPFDPCFYKNLLSEIVLEYNLPTPNDGGLCLKSLTALSTKHESLSNENT